MAATDADPEAAVTKRYRGLRSADGVYHKYPGVRRPDQEGCGNAAGREGFGWCWGLSYDGQSRVLHRENRVCEGT